MTLLHNFDRLNNKSYQFPNTTSKNPYNLVTIQDAVIERINLWFLADSLNRFILS